MTEAEKLLNAMLDLHKYAAKLRQEFPAAVVADMCVNAGIAILIQTVGQEMASVRLMHLAEICDADRLEHAGE
jgi:hypothetical protein